MDSNGIETHHIGRSAHKFEIKHVFYLSSLIIFFYSLLCVVCRLLARLLNKLWLPQEIEEEPPANEKQSPEEEEKSRKEFKKVLLLNSAIILGFAIQPFSGATANYFLLLCFAGVSMLCTLLVFLTTKNLRPPQRFGIAMYFILFVLQGSAYFSMWNSLLALKNSLEHGTSILLDAAAFQQITQKSMLLIGFGVFSFCDMFGVVLFAIIIVYIFLSLTRDSVFPVENYPETNHETTVPEKVLLRSQNRMRNALAFIPFFIAAIGMLYLPILIHFATILLSAVIGIGMVKVSNRCKELPMTTFEMLSVRKFYMDVVAACFMIAYLSIAFPAFDSCFVFAWELRALDKMEVYNRWFGYTN